MIGRTISHYRIIEKLGEGGMGAVYKAEDLKLDRHVALKLLPADWTRDSRARARFLHEAQTAAALNHPNICTIHEVDEADGQVLLAMEHIEGESLRDRIARGSRWKAGPPERSPTCRPNRVAVKRSTIAPISGRSA